MSSIPASPAESFDADRLRTGLAHIEEAISDGRVDPGRALEVARGLLVDLIDVDRIVPRPAEMTEDEALDAIYPVAPDIVVGLGNPDLLCLSGDRDQVEAAVKILTGTAA